MKRWLAVITGADASGNVCVPLRAGMSGVAKAKAADIDNTDGEPAEPDEPSDDGEAGADPDSDADAA